MKLKSYTQCFKEAREVIRRLQKQDPDKWDVGIIDREAFVEAVFLYDIYSKAKALRESYEREIEMGVYSTHLGLSSAKNHLKKFSALEKAMQAAYEVIQQLLKNQEYDKVWRTIPMGPLRLAARKAETNLKLVILCKEVLKDSLDAAYGNGFAEQLLDEMAEDNDLLRENMDNKGIMQIKDALGGLEVLIAQKETKSNGKEGKKKSGKKGDENTQ